MAFELPPLPYKLNDLEPFIDAQTVEIHYTKHHATYLKNLNTALEKYPELGNWSIESLLKGLDNVPEDIRTAVRNNGGGFYNHNLYWQNMGPKCGGEPTEPVSKAITDAFSDFTTFKAEFEKAGLGRLGSGYAWLSIKPDHAPDHPHDPQPGQPAGRWPDPAAGGGCVGTCLLPEISEPAGGISEQLVESGQLEGSRAPLRGARLSYNMQNSDPMEETLCPM